MIFQIILMQISMSTELPADVWMIIYRLRHEFKFRKVVVDLRKRHRFINSDQNIIVFGEGKANDCHGGHSWVSSTLRSRLFVLVGAVSHVMLLKDPIYRSTEASDELLPDYVAGMYLHSWACNCSDEESDLRSCFRSDLTPEAYYRIMKIEQMRRELRALRDIADAENARLRGRA